MRNEKLTWKRLLAGGLSLSMALGLCAVNGSALVRAEENEVIFAENFDSYESESEKQGFTFGNPTLTLVGEEDKALMVSDREQNYFAYAIDAKRLAGNTVIVSFDAKTVDADEEKQVNATMKTSLEGEDDGYDWICGAKVSNEEFTTITSSEYDVPAGKDSYTIYFETDAEVTYVIDNIKVTAVGEYVDPTVAPTYVDYSDYAVLKDLYQDYFKMGVACEAISHWNNDLSEIGNETKEGLMLKEFNSITFGNELKPDYNMGYKSADATETYLPFVANRAAVEMLDWAKANGMGVRGHVLVWHSQNPDAVFCKGYKTVYLEDGKTLDPSCLVDKETMEARLESYINSTIEYMYANGYGDVIYAWDVVNEAIEPGTNQYNLRDSYWYKVLGSDFIYDAFKYTRLATEKYAKEYASLYGVDADDEAAVNALMPKLVYNDYNEFMPAKRDAIIANVKHAKEDGYIDAIGMQAHLSDTTDIDAFITALKMYDEAVGEVQITELDVSETSSGANADYYHGVFYYNLFKALIQAREEGVNLTGVTIWGLTDDNSWKKESKPLIFKGNLAKKIAFDGIVNAVTGDPMPEPAFEAPDFKDFIQDFENDSNGFSPRGDGSLEVQSDVVFTGKSALHDSGRTATWNGASFDVSRFVGQTISVSAWVKSEASQVKVSADIDGSWPNIASVDTTSGEWVQIMGTYAIPSELTALKLYFEADDLSDLYIDNVEVKLVGLDETFEGKQNIASARGVGHMPVVTVTSEDSVEGKALLVRRSEQDATVKFDMSKYIGQIVTVKAQVKTDDKTIVLGVDGDNPVVLAEVASKNGEFTEIEANYAISSALTSCNFFIETDGASDMVIDNYTVRIADYTDDVETAMNFSTRWSGAGKAERVEEEDGNHVAVLTEREANYYGLVFDASAYLGMQVEISFDVKTEDKVVKVSGDIDGSWPNYIYKNITPGEYNHIVGRVNLPSDLKSLRCYIETEGTADIMVDNFMIKRVPAAKQHKVTAVKNDGTEDVISFVANDNMLIAKLPDLTKEYGEDVADEDKDIFFGWFKDPYGLVAWDFSSDLVTEDTTIYAGWASTAHSHNYLAGDVVEATCVTDGYTVYVCDCGESHKGDIVPAKGHHAGEAVEENRVEATVNASGSYDKVVYCTECKAELSRENVVIPQKTVPQVIKEEMKKVVVKIIKIIKKIIGRP